ncbi:hypothetical protein HIM_06657 [Hirsutella minnesotensis 3608]|uniref:Uncharacterized protein n=1 Tax=Hirsutella minnesotensis 3608 TaxID=1043627 RepID=A0A0F8A4Q5_9HYPO|nr:hypothetical protein HIM_06657 [Hirsutella minnesotensis 3608]
MPFANKKQSPSTADSTPKGTTRAKGNAGPAASAFSAGSAVSAETAIPHRIPPGTYFLAAQVAQGLEAEVGKDSQVARDFESFMAALGQDFVEAVNHRHQMRSYRDRARAQGNATRTVGGNTMLSFGFLLTGLDAIKGTCPHEAAAGRQAVEEIIEACGGAEFKKTIQAWMAQDGASLRESWDLAVQLSAGQVPPAQASREKTE